MQLTTKNKHHLKLINSKQIKLKRLNLKTITKNLKNLSWNIQIFLSMNNIIKNIIQNINKATTKLPKTPINVYGEHRKHARIR